VNELEELFFEKLSSNLTNSENSKIELLRMSDGALTVEYNHYPIGKIKLQGRKHWIQVLKGTYTTRTFEGDLELLISHIEEWVRYLRKQKNSPVSAATPTGDNDHKSG
jgi:hypothetical protein